MMSDRHRLLTTLDLPSITEPLIVASTRKKLEVVRKESEVAVDEILFSPSCGSSNEAIMVNDGLDVTFDESLFPHLAKLKHRHSSVDLQSFEFSSVSAT